METKQAIVNGAPVKYIQKPGLLRELGRWCRPWCNTGHVLVIAADHILRQQAAAIKAGFTREGLRAELEEFGGECCNAEINRLQSALLRCHGGLVVGIGGGKVLDTAKAVAHFAKVPVAVAPTAASSDAASSALAVLYTEDGRLDRYLPLAHNPQMVLADSQVIAAAPPRLLAAGMGDARSTWYEARACTLSGGTTGAGGCCGVAALSLARGCRDILFASGEKALEDVKAGQLTSAVEQVIEVNLYLSGLGFENGGLAAAHAVANGFARLSLSPAMHGELAAFGTLVQLVLEKDQAELPRVMEFCRHVGLPVCLEDLGCGQLGEEMLLLAAEKACAPEFSMGNMPFAVTPEELCRAILTLNQLARE